MSISEDDDMDYDDYVDENTSFFGELWDAIRFNFGWLTQEERDDWDEFQARQAYLDSDED